MSIIRRRQFKKRKKGLSTGKKKMLMIDGVLLLVFFLGMGFSVLGTDLFLTGDVGVKKYVAPTLYNVLKSAAEEGTYATEYTGSHQDSMDPTKSTEKIYHWYAPNTTAGNTLATEILDKNNVIFANHCWQMIRTTDTGGVKMIYNGEPENNQCLNTRGNHVGYNSYTTQTLNTTYYYGTSYTYDKTNNLFSLDGTVTTGTIKLGEYTCKQTITNGTCATLYLVDSLSSGSTYNVISLNGSSHYSQFGKIQYNETSSSPAHVGYMHNTVYPVNIMSPSYFVQTSSTTINTSNYYSDTIDYGNLTPNWYTLINPQLISSLADTSDLVGKYVLYNGGNTTDSSARYVVAVSGTTMYFRDLYSGDLTISMMIGDTYTDNGNDTYTINNPTLVSFVDWYNGSYSNYKGKYACDGTSTTCSNLKYISNSSVTKNYYCYWGLEHKYKYSESVSYSNGTYTLTGDIKEIWDVGDATEQTTIATHHYTCLSSSTTCSTVNYVNMYSAPNLYYVELSGVEDVDEALDNMLNNDNVNQVNSTIKTAIDAWYKRYMTSYTSKLEDTIFCNDRRITSLGGWNPDGGGISNLSNNYLKFPNYDTNNDLSCGNITDKFSLTNTKAQLTNPSGLITSSEMNVLNNAIIRKTGESYWLASPYYFGYNNARVRSVVNSGSLSYHNIYIASGLRPAISLIPGTECVSGTGSMADPYIVE